MLHVFKVTDERLTIDNSDPTVYSKYGKTYYVKASVTSPGSDSHSGRSWSKAFLTMAKAFSVIAPGDTIVFSGKIKEQLETPALISDVTVIGIGNNPHHADSHPPGVDVASATWAAPNSPTAATPLVRVNQPGWMFKNILFAGPTGVSDLNASIELYRDGGADPVEKNGSHAVIQGCRFASGYNHIHDTGGCYNVVVKDNWFVAAAHYAILGVGNIGLGQGIWQIENNRFDAEGSATSQHVKIAGEGCLIKHNYFGVTGEDITMLNTNNGGGHNNCVVENYFEVDDDDWTSPTIVGCATDLWQQNYNFTVVQIGPT